MEVGQLGKTLVARFDVRERKVGQSLHTKVFYGKRRDYGTVDNGAPDALRL